MSRNIPRVRRFPYTPITRALYGPDEFKTADPIAPYLPGKTFIEWRGGIPVYHDWELFPRVHLCDVG